MKTQLAKIKHYGTYIVYHDNKRISNQYVITRTWYENGSKHTKIINSYEDWESCVWYMAQLLLGKEIRTI